MSGLRDRVDPPLPGPVRDFRMPGVESSVAEGGLLLHTVRLPRLPLVAVSLVLDAGEAALPMDRAGWGVLAGAALQGGTSERDGDALARALEEAGSEISVATGWDAVQLEFTCLAERLPAVLPLLFEMVRAPAFPEAEVERVRERRLATLRQRAMDPGALADDAVARQLYHPDSPYGRPLGGSETTVRAPSPDDLRAMATERLLPEGGAMVVAGDVDRDAVTRLLEPLLSGWTGTPAGREHPALSHPRARARRIVLVDRPGSVQSEIRMGHTGVSRASPDRAALRVGNILLGGAFTSRLNLNLRERHGFTYGVRSRFSFRKGAGPFVIRTAVEGEVTAAAVREAMSEVEGLRAGGPRDEEVASARDYLAGIFPLQLEAAEQVAGRIGELAIHGLPPETLVAEREAVRTVSPAAVARAIRAHLRPDEMTIVVVGDAAKVGDPLRALGWGEPETGP